MIKKQIVFVCTYVNKSKKGVSLKKPLKSVVGSATLNEN